MREKKMYSMNGRVSVSLHALQAAVVFASLPPSRRHLHG